MKNINISINKTAKAESKEESIHDAIITSDKMTIHCNVCINNIYIYPEKNLIKTIDIRKIVFSGIDFNKTYDHKREDIKRDISGENEISSNPTIASSLIKDHLDVFDIDVSKINFHDFNSIELIEYEIKNSQLLKQELEKEIKNVFNVK